VRVNELFVSFSTCLLDHGGEAGEIIAALAVAFACPITSLKELNVHRLSSMMCWLEKMAHTLVKVFLLEIRRHLIQLTVNLFCVHFELCKGNLFKVVHLLVELALVDCAEAVEQ